MEAEAIQDKNPDNLASSAPKYTPLAPLLEYRKKGLTYQEIGNLTGMSKQAVWERLQDIDPHIKALKQFKDNQADIFTLHKSIIFDTLTPQEYIKASPYQRMGMIGYLDNMERLERGKATSNVGIEALVSTRITLEEASQQAQERKDKALQAIAAMKAKQSEATTEE